MYDITVDDIDLFIAERPYKVILNLAAEDHVVRGFSCTCNDCSADGLAVRNIYSFVVDAC